MPAAYNYSSTALDTQLSGGISNADTSMTVGATTGFPSVPFNLTVDVGQVNEEIVTVTAVVGLVLTVLRGQNGTVAASHLAGALVRHQAIGRDLQLSRDHEADSDGVHGLAPTDEVVGRVKVMALEGKTIDANLNTLSNIPQSAVTNLVADQGTQNTRLTNLEAADVTLAAADTALDARLDKLETSPTVNVFTSGGTWNKPANVRYVKVRVVGGGGAGGGAAATGATENANGEGGSAGGYAEKIILAAALGSTETVTIGAAGTANSGAAGGNGGNSSFGAHCTGNGGTGGSSFIGTAAMGSSGPSGGTGTGGDVNISGGNGGHTARFPASGQLVFGGEGGDSMLGIGGPQRLAGTTGISGAAGDGYGAGGSGAVNRDSESARSGGAGTAGIVIVENYF